MLEYFSHASQALKDKYPQVELYTSKGDVEADVPLVHFCHSHKGRVAAILTNDNDFMLLPHGTSVARITGLNWERMLKKWPPRCSQVQGTLDLST